jgi:hypothetical protein
MLEIILSHPQAVAMVVLAGIWAFVDAASVGPMKRVPVRARPSRPERHHR